MHNKARDWRSSPPPEKKYGLSQILGGGGGIPVPFLYETLLIELCIPRLAVIDQ